MQKRPKIFMDLKTLFPNNSKGDVSIQFNWILVLIIGAVILLFFIGITQKQKSYSEETISENVQTDLQAIFSSSYVSTGTSSIVEIPNKEIGFSCYGFKIGNQFPMKSLYSFAPDTIKSDRNTISIFAYDWSVPYRVTNFLYVTSPDIRYIILDDSPGSDGLAEALDTLMPLNYIIKDGKSRLFINKKIETGIPTTDTNNYKVRIISFREINPAFDLVGKFSNTKQKDLSAVYIDPSCAGATSEDALNCDGNLKFYNYDNNNGWLIKTSSFVGKASILAAVFSENQEIYECGMDNAFKRLEEVNKIYKKRTEDLRDFYSNDCKGLFSTCLTTLDGIASAASGKSYSDINSNSEDLNSQNNNLIAKSCPAIY